MKQGNQGKWVAISIYGLVIFAMIYVERAYVAATGGLMLGVAIGALWTDQIKIIAERVIKMLDRMMDKKEEKEEAEKLAYKRKTKKNKPKEEDDYIDEDMYKL